MSTTIEALIGENVARARTEKGWSQERLGLELGRYLKPKKGSGTESREEGWSRQAVSKAERGERAFAAVDLIALSLALEVSVTNLFWSHDPNVVIELPSGEQLTRDAAGEMFISGLEPGILQLWVDVAGRMEASLSEADRLIAAAHELVDSARKNSTVLHKYAHHQIEKAERQDDDGRDE